MLPALLFFTCMIAFLPGIAAETLPSDFILQQLQIPAFHLLFQTMIFAALLESGTGVVRWVDVDALYPPGELGFEGFEGEEIVAEDEAIIEKITVGDTVRSVGRFLRVFQQNTRL